MGGQEAARRLIAGGRSGEGHEREPIAGDRGEARPMLGRSRETRRGRGSGSSWRSWTGGRAGEQGIGDEARAETSRPASRGSGTRPEQRRAGVGRGTAAVAVTGPEDTRALTWALIPC
jgi:hypothetical protein